MSAYVAMACNNAWANARLLRACLSLSEELLHAERTSFFPSLVATFNHNLTVDWFYVDALEGGTLGVAAFVDPLPCSTVSALEAAQRAVDQRLIAVCRRLGTADEVRIHRRHHVQVERADRVLLHLFQHQIHHRGQAHAMLAGTDVAPPQLDEFFLADEAPLRAEELAELGLDEASVWRNQ